VNGSAKRLVGAFALATGLALGGVQALAAQGGGGGGGGGGAAAPADPPIVAYRKAMMQSNVQHQAALRALLQNNAPVGNSKDAIKMHAAALENNGKMFMDMWPEGSTAPTSRAKAEIWTDKAGFEARLKDFRDKSAALDEAAEKGDNAATLAAFTAFGATCGACHMAYRGPAAPPAAPAAGGGAPAPQ
jgi:cytochrome c556